MARANAYQALDGLVKRGAARRSSARPARYIALSPNALIAELDREVRRDLTALKTEFAALAQAGVSDAGPSFEALEDVGAVIARAALLAEHAERELLAVLGPWARTCFAAVDRTGSRGVASRVLALGSPAPAAATVRPVAEEELVAYWGGLPLAMVADRSAALCAIFRPDGAASGLLTRHPGVVPFLRHLLRREVAGTGGRA